MNPVLWTLTTVDLATATHLSRLPATEANPELQKQYCASRSSMAP